MRKALYYTNISLEPNNAVKYYKESLRVAAEVGMHPFSDEVLGIKIQLAYLMEKIFHFDKAIMILEIIKRDNLKWVEEYEKNGWKEEGRGDRTRILAKAVAISIKLGELYSNKYVLEKEKAEESLIWGVETVIREKKRREDEGVKPGEGDWMSDEEIGGSFEALAHMYEGKDQHYLATPLFLQSLAFSDPRSCHTVVLSKPSFEPSPAFSR